MRPRGGGSPRELLSPADRIREQELVDSIRLLLSPVDRALFDEALEKGGNWGSPALRDPEVWTLMTELMRLHGAWPASPSSAGHVEANRTAARERVSIAIALVPPHVLEGERIIVVRRASDAFPVVLLNEVDGTDIEARAGVKAATRALKANPRPPAVETRTVVRVEDFDVSTLGRGEIVSELRTEVAAHSLAGFGRVRWTVVAAPRE